MKSKIVAILLCMLMIAVIPLAAGMNCATETGQESDGIFSKTVVRGVILGSKTDGKTTSFFALRVHYTTYNLFGEDESGFIMFQKVSFNSKFTGYLGKFYVSGAFRGSI